MSSSSFFVWSILPLRWFFEDWYLMHPTFPNLPGLLSKYLLSKFSLRKAYGQERSRQHFLVKLMNSWWISLAEIGWYSTIAPKGITGPLNGSPYLFSRGVFPSVRGSWPFRRQQQHSIESDHHLSFNPDCSNTVDVSFFHSSNGSLADVICLGSMNCRSAVILW